MSQSQIRMTQSQAQRWRRLSYLVALLGGLTVGACGGGGASGGQGNVNAASLICPNVTGLEGLGWDHYNGVPRSAPGVIPPPFPVGPTFFHLGFPQLSFSHHPGWTTTSIGSNTNVGVVLVRDDQQALWKQEDVFTTGAVPAQVARDDQITRIKQFVGQAGAQIDTVCTNAGTTPLGGEYSNIMFRVGGHTAIVKALVTVIPGSTTSIRFTAMTAPTAEFGARVIDSFLAIDWQFRICTGPANDRDNDGDPDLTDPSPCDPSINTANPYRFPSE